MRGKVGSDFYLGICAIVLAATYIAVATGIQDTFLSDSVGAGGVPKSIGWLLAAVGLLLCVRSLGGRRAASLGDEPSAAASFGGAPNATLTGQAEPGATDASGGVAARTDAAAKGATLPSGTMAAATTATTTAAMAALPTAVARPGRPHLRALGLLAILAAFPVVSPYVGYPLAVGLLIAAVVWYVGGSLSRRTLLLSAVAGVCFWLLFSQVLRISLPTGIFFQGF